MSGGVRRVDDQLVNAALIAVGAGFSIAFMLRVAGTLAAVIGGTPYPRVGLVGGLRVLARPANPAVALAAPGLSAVLY